MSTMSTQCPKCKDQGIIQREIGPNHFIWVANGWINPDDGLIDVYEVTIDYCPFCGTELQDSDECGELPPMPMDIDKIEQDLARCTHPTASAGWCNLCGAQQCGDNWLLPHWRELLVLGHHQQLVPDEMD